MSSSYLKDSKWMSLRDFAAKYDLTLRTVQEYAKRGALPAKKMGPRGAWYVDMDKWRKKVEIYEMHEEETPTMLDPDDRSLRKTKGI